MRRLLIAASLAGSLIIFALTIDLFDALFMFVFFGVVPFKAEPLPASEMLLIYTAAGIMVVTVTFRTSITSLMHTLQRKQSHARVS